LQVNVLKEESAKRVLEVHVPMDEMKPYFDEALTMYREEVQIEGFRKGKAPKDIVLKRFGNAIEAEALETIVSDYYKQAIESSKTDAIAMGEISNLNYKKGEPLSFEVTVEIMPDYEMTTYKELQLTKRVHTLTPDEIDHTIQRLRENHSTVKPAEEVAAGNIVYVDIQELDDSGFAIIGKRFEDRRIPLTTEYVGQDMIDGLVGATVGEMRQVNVEKRGSESGERQRFDITIRKIEEVILPELDEEFAKDLGLETIDALKKDVEQNLLQRWDEESANDLRLTLINEIIKQNDLPSPEPLVHDNIHRFIEALKGRAGQQPIDEKYVHESYRGTAIRDVKWALAMKKIIEMESLTVDDADIERYRQKLAEKHKVSIDQIGIPNAQERRRLESHLLEEKVIDLIKTHAQITEAAYEEQVETLTEG